MIFAVCGKIVSATGQYFMPISLVTYIPNQLIVRGIIDVMKCSGQFHYAEAGPEMAAVHANDINNILAKFVTDLVEFFPWQLLEIGRGINRFQQRTRNDFHFTILRSKSNIFQSAMLFPPVLTSRLPQKQG